MKKKNTTPSEPLLNLTEKKQQQKYHTVGSALKSYRKKTQQKYHTDGTVPKFNRKLVETEIKLIHIAQVKYSRPLIVLNWNWYFYKSGGAKLVQSY
jgi:hypothetical protein